MFYQPPTEKMSLFFNREGVTISKVMDIIHVFSSPIKMSLVYLSIRLNNPVNENKLQCSIASFSIILKSICKWLYD